MASSLYRLGAIRLWLSMKSIGRCPHTVPCLFQGGEDAAHVLQKQFPGAGELSAASGSSKQHNAQWWRCRRGIRYWPTNASLWMSCCATRLSCATRKCAKAMPNTLIECCVGRTWSR